MSIRGRSVTFILDFDVAEHVAEFYFRLEAAGPAVLDDTAAEQTFTARDFWFAGAAGGDAEGNFVEAAIGRVLSDDDELDLARAIHLAGIVIGVVLDWRSWADIEFPRRRSNQRLAVRNRGVPADAKSAPAGMAGAGVRGTNSPTAAREAAASLRPASS